MSISKHRVVAGREVQDLTDFINKMTLGKPYVTKNFEELRNLDFNNATLQDGLRFLATIAKDLMNRGILPTE